MHSIFIIFIFHNVFEAPLTDERNEINNSKTGKCWVSKYMVTSAIYT